MNSWMQKLVIGVSFVACLLPNDRNSGQVVRAQPPVGCVVEIPGSGKPSENARLADVWLNPEKYVGQVLRLRGWVLEPQYFEYIPEQSGYLFSVAPRQLASHMPAPPRFGHATYLSREKLNFFCWTGEGQRISRMLKLAATGGVLTVDIDLTIEIRNDIYFAIVTAIEATQIYDSATLSSRTAGTPDSAWGHNAAIDSMREKWPTTVEAKRSATNSSRTPVRRSRR